MRGMAFITEDRRHEGLLMSLPIDFNLSMITARTHSSRIVKKIRKNQLTDVIQKTSDSLRIKSTSIFKQKPKNLSGGNQQKVVIGKWLPEEPDVFIVDDTYKRD